MLRLNISKFFIAIFFLLPNLSLADCDFVTGKFSEQLSNPKNIDIIKVEIPKSNKFAQNAFSIIASEDINIAPRFKKKFKAKITVIYKGGIGKCSYDGTVRQHGDWKDHIRYMDWKLQQSVKINLTQGNILNATRFKLLIPSTRKDLNEVFTTTLLRALGIISPETFQVRAEVNGLEFRYIFQEDTRKELLERNNRREGPILEGDESILWGFKNYDNLQLGDVALSRIINKDWLSKGEAAENIALRSFAILQNEYADNATSSGGLIKIPFTSENFSESFLDYNFLMTILNGRHGLAGHNRQFHFNMIKNILEPVYYDGNVNINRKMKVEPQLFPENYKYEKIELLKDYEFQKKLEQEFLKRTVIAESKAKAFLSSAIKQLVTNSKSAEDAIQAYKSSKAVLKASSQLDYQNNINALKKRLLHYKLKTVIIDEIKKSKDSKYLLKKSDNSTIEGDLRLLKNLVSKNSLNGKRAIYFPNLQNLNHPSLDELQTFHLMGGTIVYPKTTAIDVDISNKIVNIFNGDPLDTVLISNIEFKDWSIFYKPNEEQTDFDQQNTRFNERGLTGCVNFYNVKFFNVKIFGNKGSCEDVINIMNSEGHISVIKVKEALYDAVDFDFANIQVDNLIVTEAQNDCVDLSMGDYYFINVNLKNCGDKGVSIGERSYLELESLKISFADIGVSTKDFSTFLSENVDIKNINICIEAKQKKPEFGGAKVILKNYNCDGKISIDKYSLVSDI